MKAVIDRIISNNLEELKGLSVEGEIPVSENLLNDFIKLYLENSSSSEKPPSQNSSSSEKGIDFMQILNKLDKKEIRVELKEKVAVIKMSAKKF